MTDTTKATKAKSWRDVIKVHPAADLFPMMSTDELKALGEDIKKNGLRIPVTLWRGNGGLELLDGRNRLDAMESVGLPIRRLKTWLEYYCDEPMVWEDASQYVASDTKPWEYVLSANVHRRHLTAEQKRSLIAAVLKVQPDKSNRTIAKLTKADHKTVGAARATLEATGEIPQLAKTTGADGRTRTRAKQQAKAEHRANRESALAAKITALPDKLYGVIVADPEWRFEPYSRDTGMDRAADNHYPTSVTNLIAARDVPSIAADDCVLFLWATVPMLEDAMSVLKAWGFKYKSHAIWDKVHIGTGYWFRNRHELLLVGTKGEIPAPAMGNQPASVMAIARKEHSAKPEQFLELIEQYFPNLPKIELNRRGESRPGWDAWGNEVPPLEAAQ